MLSASLATIIIKI